MVSRPVISKSIIKNINYVADPPKIFDKLCCNKDHSLLLESADIESKHNKKSIIIIDTAVKLICRDVNVEIIALTENGKNILDLLSQVDFGAIGQELINNTLIVHFENCNEYIDDCYDEESRLLKPNPFSVLRYIVENIEQEIDSPYSVFLGGVIAYDAIAITERLPSVPEGEDTCPDYAFYLAETLVVIDHQKKTTQLIANSFSRVSEESLLFAAEQRLDSIKILIEFSISQMASSLQEKGATDSIYCESNIDVSVDINDSSYCKQVEELQENIISGDVFQVVPSRVFSIPCPDSLKAYEILRKQNPSPYMFYMKSPEFVLFGASPESALKYDHQTRAVEVYPIAGTRPRAKCASGIHFDRDGRIELELRSDSKECAEHLMLVDLARNDISRIAVAGSRHVVDLLKVDRYSHVMHLVSRVKGELRQGLDALHAYQACMNMGTLVGAPKIKAAQLIRSVEKKRRGSYGGAIGYLNGKGDMDTCIVIRSAFVKDDFAYIKAGAGVVFDSIPQAEADETRAKAQAVITAIQSSLTHANQPVPYDYV